MNRKNLKDLVKAFLETQSDDESDKDEYWTTPHKMAEDVLISFLDYAAPDPLVAQIQKLRAEAEQLEIQRAKEFWE